MSALAPATIVAMNNPYGSDARMALYPAPQGSAGHRLYCMMRDAGLAAQPSRIVRRSDYLCLERRNVLAAREWRETEARRAGRRLREELAGRRLIVCGVRTLAVLELERPPDWGQWWRSEGTEYALVPHPSGRCREYNDPALVRRTGELLLGLLP